MNFSIDVVYTAPGNFKRECPLFSMSAGYIFYAVRGIMQKVDARHGTMPSTWLCPFGIKDGFMEFICSQCPRQCAARRGEDIGEGYCRAPALPRIARAALHHWEEPCISGTRGSGTIFFSGCSLGCIYCQNYDLSHACYGETVSLERLRAILHELAAQGAHNINLVNPTHYAHLLPYIREHVPDGLPVVYNTGGYDAVETLQKINGCVDVYLTDLKYRSPLLSAKYSGAADYFDRATAAIREMYRQTGPAVYDSDGLLRRGVIVRHLVLPGYSADSLRVLEYCRDRLPDGILFSIMAQYTPMGEALQRPPLNRRLTPVEYRRVTRFVENEERFTGYMQELSSAQEEYVPSFDLTGVLPAENPDSPEGLSGNR